MSPSVNLDRFVARLFAVIVSGLSVASAQHSLPAIPLPSAAPAPAGSVTLNVVVDTKSGQPVPNLRQQDFTVLDNKKPRPITSFRIVSPAEVPVHVIVVLDAVNTPFSMVAYVREGVENFLKANEGALAHPTSIAVLSDEGLQIDDRFSTNGLALSDDLEKHQIGLRQINRSSEWSGDERLQICLNAFNQFLNFAGTLPGRKIAIWISPGWPLVSGPQVYLTQKQEEQIFTAVVGFSTQMRSADVTLYNINPVGVGESLARADYYEAFLKGVSKVNDVQPGNLGVQVIALQSGGLATQSNSDVTGLIRKCLADVDSWYEIAFDPPPPDKPNEYHHLDVKVDQRDTVVRTRDGYYSNPMPLAAKH